jgi:hypothetical protein
MQHVWTVVCTRTVIDQQTNNISLFEVLEQIQLSGPPLPSSGVVLPTNFEVVSFWTRSADADPERGRARLRFASPTGQVINESEYEIDLSTFVRTRTIAKMSGFPISAPGRYYFQVDLRNEAGAWEAQARVPVTIVLESPELLRTT